MSAPDSPLPPDTPRQAYPLKVRLLLALAVTLVVASVAFWSGYSELQRWANNPGYSHPYYAGYPEKRFIAILTTTLVFSVVVFGVMLGILSGLKRRHLAWSIASVLVIAACAAFVGFIMTMIHAQPPIGSNM